MLRRFLEYAAEFERAYASRDFAPLARFFSEDACYEIHADGEPVQRHAGRDAVLGYLAYATEHFDRRFAERRLVHLSGPHERTGEIETHGMALYRLASGECCHLPMTETARFRGDVIECLVDRLSPGAWHEMQVFVARHPELFPPALLEGTSEAARAATPSAPAIARAVAFLHERRAGAIAHPGGDLLAHLLRTHALLCEWNAAEPLRLAGLCHAAYGTDGFPTSLVDVADRARLRAVIGADAEQIVYVYAACARRETFARLGERPLRVADRFTGAHHAIDGADAHAFALLTIANELDVVRAGSLAPAEVDGIRELIAALAPYAPSESARALAGMSSPRKPAEALA